eukprot:s2926_g5.t1
MDGWMDGWMHAWICVWTDIFWVGGLPGPLWLPAWLFASRDTPLPLGGLSYALNGRLYEELGGPSEPLRKYATYKI